MQPREVSVEFHKVDGVRQIKWSKSTPERIAAIEDYRKQVENTGEINYLVDDVRQWGQMVDFCMKFGITSEEEDILSTMGPLKNN